MGRGTRGESRDARGIGALAIQIQAFSIAISHGGHFDLGAFCGRTEREGSGRARRWRRTSGLRDSREYGFIYTVHSSVIFSRSKHNGRTTGGQPVQYGCLLRSMPIIHRVLNTGPSICKVKDWPIGSGPVGSAAMKQTIVEKDG